MAEVAAIATARSFMSISKSFEVRCVYLPALALNIKPFDECQPRNRSQLGGKYNKCSLLVIFYDVEYVERSV